MPASVSLAVSPRRGQGPSPVEAAPSFERPDELRGLLVDLGVVTSAKLVHAEVMVTDVTRRNRNFLVAVDRQPAAFVTTRPWASANDFDTEVERYELLSTIGMPGAYLPRLIAADRPRRTLVFEHVGSNRDLWDLHRRSEEPPYGLALQVGTFFARLHEATAGLESAREDACPWALTVARPALDELRVLTGASTTLLRQIQADAKLCELLDAAADALRPRCLIHGDVTWTNLLVRRAQPQLCVVDWERCSVGDPLWDVAGLLGAHVTFSLHRRSDPVGSGLSDGDLRELAFATWDGYRHTVSGDVLERVTSPIIMGLVAARLIQSAYETTQALDRWPRRAQRHVELARHIAADPDGAGFDLFRLDLSTRSPA